MSASIDPIVLYAIISKLKDGNGGSNNGGGTGGGSGSVSPSIKVKDLVFENNRLLLKMTDGTSFSAPFSEMLLHQNKNILDKLSADNKGQLKYDGKFVTNLQETVKDITLKEDTREIEIIFADDKIVSIGLDPMLQEVVKEVLENENITGGTEIPSNIMSFFGKVDVFSDLNKIQEPKDFQCVIVENDSTKDNQRSLYIYKEKKWLWLGSLSQNRDFTRNPINLETEVIGAITEKIIPNTIARVSQLHNHNNKDVLDKITENSYGDILFNGKKISSFKVRDKDNKVFNNVASLSLGNFLGILQGDTLQLTLNINSTEISDMPKIHYNGKVLVSNSDTNSYELKSVEEIGMYKENFATTITTEQWGSNSALGYYEKNITHNLNSKNLIVAFYNEEEQSKILEYTVVDELNIKVKSQQNEPIKVVINCSQGTVGDREGGSGGNLDHTHSNLDILNDFSIDKYGQLRFRQHIVYPNFDPYNYSRKWENQNNSTLEEIVKFQQIFNEKDIRVITGSQIVIENRNNITGNSETDKKNEVHLIVKEGGITTLDTKIKPRDTQKYVTGINPDTRIFVKGYFSGNLSLNYFDTASTSTRQVITGSDDTDLSDFQLKIDNALKTNNKTVVGGINEINDLVKSNVDKLIDFEIELNKKQNKEDDSLTTTTKTIVGGINELNKKIEDIGSNSGSNNTEELNALKEKVETNNNNITNINTKIDDIQITCSTHEEDIRMAEANIDRLQNDVKSLNTKAETNKADISTLQSKNTQIDTKINELEQSNTSMQNNVSTNTQNISTLNEKIQNIEPFDKTVLNDYQKKIDDTLIGDDKNLISVVNKNVNSINSVKTDVSTNKTDIANLKTTVDNIPSFDESKLDKYQTIQSDSLTTTNKTIPTAINEINANTNSNSTEINSIKQQLGDIEPFDKTVLNNYQLKSDNALDTQNKEIVKAINEINTKATTNSTTLTEHSNSISENTSKISQNTTNINENLTKINKNISDITDLKTKTDTLETNITSNTSKITDLTTKVNSIEPFNPAVLDSYQTKEDTTLTTINKEVVKAINEVNNVANQNNQQITNVNNQISTLQPKDDNNIDGDDKNVVSVINKLLSGGGGSSFEGSYSDNEKLEVSAGISKSATIEDDYKVYIDAGVLAFVKCKNITDSNFSTFFGRYFTLEGSVGSSVGVLNQGEIKNSTGVFLGKDIQTENCTDVVVIGNRASATNATRSVIIGNSGGVRGDDPNSKVDNIYVFGNSAISNQSNYVSLGDSTTQNLYCNATYITHPCDPRLKENIKSADEQIITDALKQVNIIHASYKNLKEFQGNRANDLKKLMFDADNMSQIKLFSKDVKARDKYVTPLNENGEPVATYTKLDDDGNEVIEPVQELIEDCKEFTPNQITPALIVGWQTHEKRIAELEKENALLKQEIENIKNILVDLQNK